MNSKKSLLEIPIKIRNSVIFKNNESIMHSFKIFLKIEEEKNTSFRLHNHLNSILNNPCFSLNAEILKDCNADSNDKNSNFDYSFDASKNIDFLSQLSKILFKI